MENEVDFRQQVQELMLLQRVAQRIGSILDLDILLEEVVGDVAETFGYTRSAVLLKDKDDMIIAAVRGWSANVHKKGERFKIGAYGIIGHVAATGEYYYAPDVSVDPHYQVSEPLTQSELDIPLRVRGELIGIFDVQTPDKDGFSQGRIQVLEALAAHIATAIDNAQLFSRERREKQRILDELEEAQTIQRALLPNDAPSPSGFNFSGICLPCRAVGGDWYDYIPLPDGRVAIVLGDVSGKGMAAALLMSSTRSLVRLLALQSAGPSLVLSQLNEVLLKDFPRSRFVTMIYALLSPHDGTLTYARAGHNPPLLIAGGAAQPQEEDSGLPLGIKEGEFNEVSIALKAGHRFIIYSDGVSEASTPESEEYGPLRIQLHFQRAQSSVETLLRDVHHFTGCVALADDATVVLIEAVEPK